MKGKGMEGKSKGKERGEQRRGEEKGGEERRGGEKRRGQGVAEKERFGRKRSVQMGRGGKGREEERVER